MSISDHGYLAIVRFAVKNTHLDPEDRLLLKEVVNGLDLLTPQALQDMSQRWQVQQRLEADVIYLLTKYESLAARQERFVEEVEAAEFLTLPDKKSDGRKYTVEDKKHLLKISDTVKACEQTLLDTQELSSLMNKLSKTVFGRNQKLDHMGVNYRRELSFDENSH